MTNCTISGNSSTSGNGGGVYVGGNASATLTNCTVSGNSASANGGGLYSFGGAATIGNTIVAANTTTSSGPDAFGTVTSQGNNLIGETDGSSGWIGSDLTGTIATPINPLLAPLGNYGGPTQTMPLLPGSPAIDTGSNALIPGGVTDQRGASFPRFVNVVVDIGAFESTGFTVTVQSGDNQSTAAGTAFANPLTVIVVAVNPAEPVAGGEISWIANPSAGGAGATLSGPTAAIAGGGTASITVTANSSSGSYTVSAFAAGAASPATFHLSNPLVLIGADPPGVLDLPIVGQAFTVLVGSFTTTYSTAVASDFSAAIDWGDPPGLPTSSGVVIKSVPGGFDVYGTHVYTIETSYLVYVTVSGTGPLVPTSVTDQVLAGTAVALTGSQDNQLISAGFAFNPARRRHGDELPPSACRPRSTSRLTHRNRQRCSWPPSRTRRWRKPWWTRPSPQPRPTPSPTSTSASPAPFPAPS